MKEFKNKVAFITGSAHGFGKAIAQKAASRGMKLVLVDQDEEALNKVIWKVYYEKPTSDMIGRVVGATEKTGIYKITEIATGKCYVGQAVGISSRWK